MSFHSDLGKLDSDFEWFDSLKYRKESWRWGAARLQPMAHHYLPTPAPSWSMDTATYISRLPLQTRGEHTGSAPTLGGTEPRKSSKGTCCRARVPGCVLERAGDDICPWLLVGVRGGPLMWVPTSGPLPWCWRWFCKKGSGLFATRVLGLWFWS